MKYFRLVMILFFFGIMTQCVFAETQSVSDTAELSFVDTGGNTKVTSLVVNNLLKYKLSDHILAGWKINALYGKNDNIKSAERYFTELRGDYLITERMYSMGLGSWVRDTFSGIDSRYILGAGAGYKIIVGLPHKLMTEALLTYTMENMKDGTNNNYPGGRLSAKYEYSFDNKNTFSQLVEWMPDFRKSENYNINSETALINSISTFLSMKTSYVLKYDNEPAAGTKTTDTILGITLVMNLL